MRVDIKEFLDNAGIGDTLYPGKRIVKPCKHIGDYKNHCVVVNWRTPETITIDIRPGLSGKNLPAEILKKYPVCFQMPTRVEIKVVNDNGDDEGEEEKGKSGRSSGGGGGKKPAHTKPEDMDTISARFGDSAEGTIPSGGEITNMIVMGVQIAKESFATAFAELTRQIRHAKITATEILSKAADMVTHIQPPSYVKPKGYETVQYDYDVEKNADIGMQMSLG